MFIFGHYILGYIIEMFKSFCNPPIKNGTSFNGVCVLDTNF